MATALSHQPLAPLPPVLDGAASLAACCSPQGYSFWIMLMYVVVAIMSGVIAAGLWLAYLMRKDSHVSKEYVR